MLRSCVPFAGSVPSSSLPIPAYLSVCFPGPAVPFDLLGGGLLDQVGQVSLE